MKKADPKSINLHLKCDSKPILDVIREIKLHAAQCKNPRMADLFQAMSYSENFSSLVEIQFIGGTLTTICYPSARLQRIVKACRTNDLYAFACEVHDMKEGVPC